MPAPKPGPAAKKPPASSPPDATYDYMPPPQSGGIPQRLYSQGAPADEERPNVALLALRDPVARNSFSRNYSGQRRGWNR